MKKVVKKSPRKTAPKKSVKTVVMSETLEISMSKKGKAQLKAFAKKNKTTMSDLVRSFIVKCLPK